eukprot:1136406-Pelagomonas_calceolata.AAC.3
MAAISQTDSRSQSIWLPRPIHTKIASTGQCCQASPGEHAQEAIIRTEYAGGRELAEHAGINLPLPSLSLLKTVPCAQRYVSTCTQIPEHKKQMPCMSLACQLS